MSFLKKFLSSALILSLILCACPIAYAADTPEEIVYVEDLGNDVTVKTTITVYPKVTRDKYTTAISTSDFTRGGKWIATVSLQATFMYNSIVAGVTGTTYSKSLASGWSYTNHKITTTTVSSSNGGTATLTATLKDFPVNVPVRLSLHCSPHGTVTRG